MNDFNCEMDMQVKTQCKIISVRQQNAPMMSLNVRNEPLRFPVCKLDPVLV